MNNSFRQKETKYLDLKELQIIQSDKTPKSKHVINNIKLIKSTQYVQLGEKKGEH